MFLNDQLIEKLMKIEKSKSCKKFALYLGIFVFLSLKRQKRISFDNTQVAVKIIVYTKIHYAAFGIEYGNC